MKFGTDARQSVRELVRKTLRFGHERAPPRFAAMVQPPSSLVLLLHARHHPLAGQDQGDGKPQHEQEGDELVFDQARLWHEMQGKGDEVEDAPTAGNQAPAERPVLLSPLGKQSSAEEQAGEVWLARSPVDVVEFFASSEGNAVLVNLTGQKVGSLGRPLPGAGELAVAAWRERTAAGTKAVGTSKSS